MPRTLVLPCVLSVSLLAATSQADPRKPTHVACVGDSITAGTGASDPSKNYVSNLQGLMGNAVQVKNFGHSGATMLSAGYGDLPYNMQVEYTNATDFVSNAGAGSVVSVIIILGANDSKPFNWEPAAGKNDQQYLKDYRAMVDHFLGLATKPVVYVGLPLATGNNPCCSIRGDVIHDQEIPLIKQVAMEKHLPIIDLNTDTTGHPEYFGDGVHPNDGGYVVMANLAKKGLDRVPTVSITGPVMGSTVGFGMLPLTADAAADFVDISSVEFFEGATSLGKATTAPFSVTTTPTAGPHSITAKVTDATLANATSAAVSYTVAAGGTGGAAGAGGAAGTGGAASGGVASGGVASGGVAGAGTPAGGAPSAGAATGGSAVIAGGGTPSAGGTDTASPTQTDAGCSCSVPGSRSGNRLALLSFASALLFGARRRRRQRPSTTHRG